MYGLMSAHIQGSKLDMTFMSGSEVPEIAHFFEIPIDVDVPTSTPGLYKSEAHPLRSYVEQLVKVLNDVGGVLSARRFRSLGHFILDTLDNAKSTSCQPLLRELVTVFRAFQDRATYKDHDVFLCRKAQRLAWDLCQWYGDRDPRFAFDDLHALTAFADNNIPSVLRKLGVLQWSEAVATVVDSGVVLQSGGVEVELRAVSVAAVDAIALEMKSKFGDAAPSAVELGMLFSRMGKKEYAEVPKFLCQDTVMY
eukprot:TRINITY_DN2683_c0_g1_i1.p1 TRINITY_DN2683_c0_g1~~TRINITY_DN2683_c0_g1_i1.p1  ORF type:complete len:252 (+),score=55.11 TRINITY_DN2683_c0_g1_i1:376-1131(+)